MESDTSPLERWALVESDTSTLERGALVESDTSPSERVALVESDTSPLEWGALVESDTSPLERGALVESDNSPLEQGTLVGGIGTREDLAARIAPPGRRNWRIECRVWQLQLTRQLPRQQLTLLTCTQANSYIKPLLLN